MWGRYKVNIGPMWGRCRVDVGSMRWRENRNRNKIDCGGAGGMGKYNIVFRSTRN